MITVKYPDGRTDHLSYVIASGDPPIGMGRPLPDGATLEIMSGCIRVEAPKDSRDNDKGAIIWPWSKLSELTLGPAASGDVTLRETK